MRVQARRSSRNAEQVVAQKIRREELEAVVKEQAQIWVRAVGEGRQAEFDRRDREVRTLSEGRINILAEDGRDVTPQRARIGVSPVIHHDNHIRRKAGSVIHQERAYSTNQPRVIDELVIIVDGHAIRDALKVIDDLQRAFRGGARDDVGRHVWPA